MEQLKTDCLKTGRGKMSCKCKLLNIGFGNSIVAERVVAIVNPVSAPIKRLREEAKNNTKLIDATQGRRTRSIIITDSNHVILSAIQAETIAQRLAADVLTKIDEKEGKEDLQPVG